MARGKRSNEWETELGLAILCTKELTDLLGPPPRCLEDIAAWMGMTREGTRIEIKRTLRKFRIRLIERCPEIRNELELGKIGHEFFRKSDCCNCQF